MKPWTLEELLKQRKITTGQFARMVGMNKKTIEKWMEPGGMDRMTAQRMKTICGLLDCGVLITGDGITLENYEDEWRAG